MKQLVGPSGKWWRYYAPRTLSGDMRDGLLDLPSLGQAAGFVTTPLRFVTFVYLFIITGGRESVKPLNP